ncbi:50S ribosomal protein L11 methyltransferase [Brevibacillus choshinensis]|uniref:Ribosomal protein L11 methyltransferase n=1 Tax=Brevibacillus choshinensis TaxID=54911 RepID=A0ABR5NAU5_BRECH|nr:50S ribosomal protein L11 methyltransferase [Brevibacillus choshinensis]KQL48668.1 50S ribosomal protein L11 methyltransferase [Brevibacillus choshinensis]
MTENMWLKYTLLIERETEDPFVAEVLTSPYTLGWIEPQIEVLTTENGYDFAEDTDGPVVGYLFEPMQDSEEAHTQRLRLYIQRWKGHVSLKEVELVPEENDSWKEEFREVQVGNWWIAPTWTDPQALETAEHILWIDPGAAFGTGYHGTTQDMLLFLQELSLTGKRVLDIGAGSGILSLYCVLNGASQPVCAVDINPQSEYQVLVNATNNHLPESTVNVVIGDAQEPSVADRLPEMSDLILLNIGGDEDIAMLPVVERHMAPEGLLLLSGIVEWNRDHVITMYEQAGYRLEKERQTDEWITVMLRKQR